MYPENKKTPRMNHPYVDTNIQVPDAKSMSAMTTNLLQSQYMFIRPALVPPGSRRLSRACQFPMDAFDIAPPLHKPKLKERGTVPPCSPMSSIVPIHKQCM
ncbi:hypothetical protein AnigIFM63309_009138 [Aspergillus niger]|nr:hypothetical protein AnigIFM49718_010298 [Aspergillus niger]GKZ66084.1 hypothetical protein AnigIFM50267_010923 [Aspergillus niger]GLA34953.1 hypothetical protein AnigIFM63309_009138 [Aspergillus niger]